MSLLEHPQEQHSLKGKGHVPKHDSHLIFVPREGELTEKFPKAPVLKAGGSGQEHTGCYTELVIQENARVLPLFALKLSED